MIFALHPFIQHTAARSLLFPGDERFIKCFDMCGNLQEKCMSSNGMQTDGQTDGFSAL